MTKYGFFGTEFVANFVATKFGFCRKKALSLALLRKNLVLLRQSLLLTLLRKKYGFFVTEFVANSVATKSGFCRKKALSLALLRQNLLRDLFSHPT